MSLNDAELEEARKALGLSPLYCALCKPQICAGHSNMRDPSLNSPGAGHSPGFITTSGTPRAPWGYISERKGRNREAIARERADLARKRAALASA